MRYEPFTWSGQRFGAFRVLEKDVANFCPAVDEGEIGLGTLGPTPPASVEPTTRYVEQYEE